MNWNPVYPTAALPLEAYLLGSVFLQGSSSSTCSLPTSEAFVSCQLSGLSLGHYPRKTKEADETESVREAGKCFRAKKLFFFSEPCKCLGVHRVRDVGARHRLREVS